MTKIKLENINKSFGDNNVLKDISLDIEEGKIYGLLGRNGVGKTTLLNIINNRIFADSGEVLIDGRSVEDGEDSLRNIYFMTEKNMMILSEKVKNLYKYSKYFYDKFDMDYAMDLSRKFKLNVDKKFGTLSTGYKTISKMIMCLASGAEVMIFDEPVLGLDANHRELFYKELIKRYEELQNTMILSTHIIEEISNIVEKVIILHDGKVFENTDVYELLNRAYAVSGNGDKVDKYIKGKNVIDVENLGSFKKATILEEKTKEDLDTINMLGLELSNVELQKLFLKITNKEEE